MNVKSRGSVSIATYFDPPVARMYYAASTTICYATPSPQRTRRPGRRSEAGLAEVFRKAGFTQFRRAKETPFNLILEAQR